MALPVRTSSSTRQVAMTGSALELTVAGDPTLAAGDQLTVLVGAPAAVDMYVGYTSGVTTGNGFLVPKGTSIAVELGAGERLFGIGASGTAYVLLSRL